MKQTFLRCLGELAALTGYDLTSRAEMVTRWVEEFGARPDEEIEAAFAGLKRPEAVGQGRTFPNWYELGRAFDAARAEMRRRRTARSQPPADRAATLRTGALLALYDYARLNRDHLSQQQIDEDLAAFQIARLSAGEIREMTAASPGGKAAEARIEEEQTRLQRAKAAAAEESVEAQPDYAR